MEAESVSAVDFDELVEAATTPGKALGERLDLVEHVRIQMTVSIGNADLSVADLFALDAGKVVPLDKQVDSPVDLCVNGRVVGRGTLVAVGDQFGVRVTEIDAH
jgi:flagellar motor switch protein FliN/FliY